MRKDRRSSQAWDGQLTSYDLECGFLCSCQNDVPFFMFTYAHFNYQWAIAAYLGTDDDWCCSHEWLAGSLQRHCITIDTWYLELIRQRLAR